MPNVWFMHCVQLLRYSGEPRAKDVDHRSELHPLTIACLGILI
jgi:hypothetical protein